MIDGAPIVCVAIISGRIKKTGVGVQTYIIRSDIDPVTANRLGKDKSICGECPLKGIANLKKGAGTADKRACYVTLAQGPLGVFKGLMRGIYPVAENAGQITAIGAGRYVRMGTYGDPEAVPRYVWDWLLAQARSWTGYSHQATMDHTRLMASADDLKSAIDHWEHGRRTFRVLRPYENPVAELEILCPSPRVSCADCGLCQGTSKGGKSVAIYAHGTGKNNLAA